MFELLDAFNKIQIQYPEVSLHLVGDGPERPTVEQKISILGLQERVQLLGYMRGKEKAQALVNADIFILPTYYREGCPISLLEAMAAGLPVITTTVGGIPDIIIDKKNGILLKSHTPDAIEQGIRKMLKNTRKRKKIGLLNKEFAWENYESKIVTLKIEKIYKQVSNMELV
jgi:glycosyltransferase involved in cell wall biosynthesis